MIYRITEIDHEEKEGINLPEELLLYVYNSEDLEEKVKYFLKEKYDIEIYRVDIEDHDAYIGRIARKYVAAMAKWNTKDAGEYLKEIKHRISLEENPLHVD